MYTPGSVNRLDTKGGHSLTVAGYVDTSHGRVTTTVSRALANTSVHRWTYGENTDGLDASWTDGESVTVDGRGASHDAHRPHVHHGLHHDRADDRLRTALTLGDRAAVVEARDGRRIAWSRLDDTYTGDVGYTANVPSDQRHAIGTTRERYRLHGSGGCYDRRLTTVQGVHTEDCDGC